MLCRVCVTLGTTGGVCFLKLSGTLAIGNPCYASGLDTSTQWLTRLEIPKAETI